MDRKMVPLYKDELEMELWESAESVAREEHDAKDVREGKVLGQIAAAYLGIDGPLNGEGET